MYDFKPQDAQDFARFVGIQAKVKGNQLQFKECPYCRRTTSDKYTFAISMKTGQFNCMRSSCGVRGNMITLSQDFGFSLGQNVDEYYKPRTDFKKFSLPEKIQSKDPAVQYLLNRGISEEITKKYEITVQNRDNKILVFPFRTPEGETVYVKYRKTNFDKSRDQNKEWCESNGKPILFGMNHCDLSVKTLIITEGQIDSLSVAEAGYTNAVSVPNGCNGFTWFPYCYDWLQNFDILIIFGDYEKGHMTLLDDLRIRCKQTIKHVRAEDYKGCKDANEILQKYGREQVKTCVENAEADPIPHIRNLKDVEVKNPYDVQKIKTGLKAVDDLLRGGLPLGSVVLITGKAGEGKSVLSSELMLSALDQGHKIFAYSGELPDWAFKAIAMQQAGGKHCFKYQTRDGYDGWTVSDDNRTKIEEWLKGVMLYDDRIMEDQEETVTLSKLIEESIQRYGADFILVDNLMTALELEDTGENSKYDKQSTFVKRLARIARTYNVVIVLVAHMRKNNSNYNGNDEVAGSSDITNLASITLMYEKDKELNPEQRLLKVWKNRLFGFTNTSGILMMYDEKSKRIYGADDDVNKDYGWYDPEFEDIIPDELPF